GSHALQILLFRFGNAKTIKGALDVFRHFVPVSSLLFCCTDEVVDVVEVDTAEISAPRGHWLAEEDFVCLQAILRHPCRLVLHLANLAHDVGVQTLLTLESIEVIRVAETVFLLIGCANAIEGQFFFCELLLACYYSDLYTLTYSTTFSRMQQYAASSRRSARSGPPLSTICP